MPKLAALPVSVGSFRVELLSVGNVIVLVLQFIIICKYFTPQHSWLNHCFYISQYYTFHEVLIAPALIVTCKNDVVVFLLLE